MGLDGIHPRVLRKLAEVLTKPLSIICQQSCLNWGGPSNWRLANPSTRSVGRRIQGTTGLSVCPRCQGEWWSREV